MAIAVKNPALWRLSVEVDSAGADIVLSSHYEEPGLIVERLPFPEGAAPLQAFEEAIYANPALLSDFARADVLIATNRFTIVPAALQSDEARADAVSMLWPDKSLATVADPISTTGCTLLMAVDQSLLAFCRRTFVDSRPRHALSVLASYFWLQSRHAASPKVFARMRRKGVDVVAFCNGKLMIANAFDAPTVDDAAYCVLASAQAAGLPLAQTEVMVCGDPEMRQQLMAALREFCPKTMPAIFPSEALKLGPQAVKAPFHLIVLPLCE